jgi:hypothetical protein
MKKFLITTLLSLAVFSTSFAQAPVKTITGNLTGIINWSNDTIYKISGKVYLKYGCELNIAPGTVIKGDKSVAGSALIVTRGAKIFAIGTPTQPIVFTSSEAPGNRAIGDWGGIVIAGNAKVNVPGGEGTFEGGNLANPDGTTADGKYGGSNDADNSGELRYVRIEFAGYAYAPNNELNSLTLGAVGSNTKISYIQCSYGLDDHFEWFGGTVDAHHLVSYRAWDDDFDTDFGYRGRVQFGVCLRDSALADQSKSNGFETDNNSQGNNNEPITQPVFSNMTIVGPLNSPNTTINTDFANGAHIRRNSRLSLFNSIIMGWPTGIKIDGDSCQKYADLGELKIKNTVVAGCGKNLDSTTTSTAWNITNYYNTTGWGNTIYANNSDVYLTDPFNYASPDFRPTAVSPMLTGADFSDSKLATGFTAVAYRGAFGTDNWMQGWTNFDPQNEPYEWGILPVGLTQTEKTNLDVTVYPNPATNETSIALTAKENAILIVEITDLNGAVLMKKTFSVNKGFNRVQLNIASLQNGFYILKMKSNKAVATEKLTILK